MNKFNLYDYIKLKALSHFLNETDIYFYRKICRWYSKEFSTPLKEVEELPWDELLLHYYETSLETMGYNDAYDIAVESYLPEVLEAEAEANEEYARQLEEEEQTKIIEKNKDKINQLRNKYNSNDKQQSLNNKCTENKSTDSKTPTTEFNDVDIDFGTDLEKEMKDL